MTEHVGLHRLDRLCSGRQSAYLYQLKDETRETRVRVLRRRRKTLSLHVQKGVDTELRVPVNCSWEEIHGFLAARFDWILSAEEELRNRDTGPVDCFHGGGDVSFLGRRFQLDLVNSRYTVVEPSGDRLYVSCRNPNNPGLVEKHVMAFFRRRAEDLFPKRIDMLLAGFPVKVEPRNLKIRRMKARWGSCSTGGEICLNLMLMREQLSQIDFVIAHELCHLVHFAHNKAFYDLLDEVMPDWRKREKLLGRVL